MALSNVGVNAVNAIEINDSNIYIGGNIYQVGNEKRGNFASFSIPKSD